MSSIDSDIRKIRAAQAKVTVLLPGGAPLAGREVTVAQTRHKFLFGSSGFDLALANGELQGERKERAELRRARQMELMNAITLPFYWGRFEPVRGRPDTARLMAAAKWLVERGVLVKGHPLCWHTVTAPWLMDLSNAEILKVQVERIQREVTGFRGVIDAWDVLNEAVIMPVFDKYDNGITRICKELGRINTIRTMFDAARQANPAATLLINDFDVSSAYDILVEGCLAAGIQFDVIGVQSHMHQGYWGPEKTSWVLANFERFRLPIHFTENTILSGQIIPPEITDLNDYQVEEWPTTPAGEERQAREVLTHYKTLMAHPLVESITWWDISDGGWLRAPAGLLRIDASPKPAYEELLKLVKGEWWLKPTRFTTAPDGALSFTGFLGDYELSFDGKKIPFTLDQKGSQSVTIRI
jgi:GH35 family endo-1,4-beta-xylanase